VGTLKRVRAALNPSLDIDGVLLTMYDERTNLGQQVSRDVRAFFKEKVFHTVIPRNVRLGEAPSHGMPVILYDVKSRGAEAYSRSRGRCSRATAAGRKPRRPRTEATMVEKRHALGRGLDALISDALEGTGRTPGTPFEVDIDRLAPNSYQPRSRTEDARIDELAQSIRANGVIQPILVRPKGGGYQIIAGERRWHAAQRAGLLKVPITVRDVAEGQDLKLLEWALVENLQREDLNVIEEAQAYRRLADEFGLTQEDIASLSARTGQRSPTSSAC